MKAAHIMQFGWSSMRSNQKFDHADAIRGAEFQAIGACSLRLLRGKSVVWEKFRCSEETGSHVDGIDTLYANIKYKICGMWQGLRLRL